ncbi:MAG: hypothetical protein KAW14_09515 [Candidatus Aegiribacteria sp.]|nr:hypothetical protein [Candidatus Aegiribacteria sp.]
MTKLMLVLLMIIGMALSGCGEQPGTAGEGDAEGTDAGEVTGGDESGDSEGGNGESATGSAILDLSTPELAIGQWIEFGADDIPQTVTISVVATEENQGTECYWVQLSGEDFVAQILVDPIGINIAFEGYEEMFGDFMVDPADYIRENMADADGMADMFGNDENMDKALDFLRAIRMIKFDQQGMIMAIDMAGVPEFLEGMMDDPAFKEQFQQGFTEGFTEEGGQEGLNEFLTELDNIEFAAVETEVEVAGQTVTGLEFSIIHPEGEIVAVISSELPLVPLAYASVTGFEDDESHSVQVRGFGFEGAENLLPGVPAQTIPAMMFLQGMTQQMGEAGAPQGRGIN